MACMTLAQHTARIRFLAEPSDENAVFVCKVAVPARWGRADQIDSFDFYYNRSNGDMWFAWGCQNHHICKYDLYRQHSGHLREGLLVEAQDILRAQGLLP